MGWPLASKSNGQQDTGLVSRSWRRDRRRKPAGSAPERPLCTGGVFCARGLSCSRARQGIAGAVAAGVGLAAGELVAGFSPVSVSLTEAVGGLVIDYVPPPVERFAMAVFGVYDKAALIMGMTAVAVLLGAFVGRWAAHRWAVAWWVFGLFGLLGAYALSREPGVGWLASILSAGFAVGCGLTALTLLMRRLGADIPTAHADSNSDDPLAAPLPESQGTEPSPPGLGLAEVSRRTFLVKTGSVLGVGVAMAVGGRFMLERTKRALANRQAVVLPELTETTVTTSTTGVPTSTRGVTVVADDQATVTQSASTTTTDATAQGAGALPPRASLDVVGISPIITPNEDFYLIDTALSRPQVALEEWTLRVIGLVERPIEMNFDELLTRPLVERYITLCCVSNPVGGSLVGNAKWLGVPLSLILDEAGLLPEAEQIVGRSVDGYTVGFPSSIPYDGRDALVAVGMNDEPLPTAHGFPVRLVVAGLYGYVSATKWLSELELTTWNGFDAYWVPKGRAKQAPVKTQSRIDTPRKGRIGTGRRPIAGVAWAPHLGIRQVEVQVDSQPWVEAELSETISDNSWRQWKVDWEPTPGDHRIRVRATDGDGVTQDEALSPPTPDGATGWHTIDVTVA